MTMHPTASQRASLPSHALRETGAAARMRWFRDGVARYRRSPVKGSIGVATSLTTAGWLAIHGQLASMPLAVVLVLCGAALMVVAALCIAHALAVRAALSRLASTIHQMASDDTSRFLTPEGPEVVARLIQAINDARRRCAEREAELLAVQASYAHDLRTPMTRLMLRCELVDDARLRAAIERDLDEMRELAEASLACARMQGRTVQTLRQVDADRLLEGMVENYRGAGRVIELDGRIGRPVTTCPHALRRILANLIDNALRYGDDARLLVRIEAQRLHVAILDSGPGIAPTQLEAVFMPWYRVPDTAGRAPGSGLGLAIARRLAQAIRADLWLENRAEGGLAARLTLPL